MTKELTYKKMCVNLSEENKAENKYIKNRTKKEIVNSIKKKLRTT